MVGPFGRQVGGIQGWVQEKWGKEKKKVHSKRGAGYLRDRQVGTPKLSKDTIRLTVVSKNGN